MKLDSSTSAVENEQQRIFRLMSALASSGCAADGAWLQWFHTTADKTLGKSLRELLLKMRWRQQSCFVSPAPVERLQGVRDQMQQLGLDAFLLGHDDENLSEYVTPGGERLRWLSGFRGSAGFMLVTQDSATLFVDGRYTLQAPTQVDIAQIGVQPWHKDSIENVLKSLTKGEGWQVGLDARLFSQSFFADFSKKMKNLGCNLQAVSFNPVDQVWQNQPPPPVSPLTWVDAALHGQNSHEKLEHLREKLSEQQADCVLLQPPEDIAWLLNMRAEDIDTAPLCLSRLIVHAEGSIDWFVTKERRGYLRDQTLPESVYLHSLDDFDDALKMLGQAGATVWCDPARTAAHAVSGLRDSGAQVLEKADPVWPLASCLNTTEIAAMRQAHKQDGVALVSLMATLAEDPAPVQESDIADKLLALRQQQPDFLQQSFHAIVAAAANSAVCHYRPKPDADALVCWGDIVLIDSGGHYRGGTTDVTRVLGFDQGEVAHTQEFRRHYTRVLQGLIAVITARFPHGTTGTQLDALARAPLWRDGLDYDHGTGHGVGANLMVHFGQQSLSKTGTTPLRAGMVVSIEPGVYLAEHYGIRLENLAVITEEGKNTQGRQARGKNAQTEDDTVGFYRFENLTWAPFVARMIDLTLLSDHELEWLNNYHARVYRTLAPKLSPQASTWLAQQTKYLNR